MPLPQDFKAMVIKEAGDGQFVREIARRRVEELPDGDVLIKVRYSSLNYKDALSATGHKGVTRNYPHTPGIDAAGTIAASSDSQFAPGDEVVVTGFDLGANTAGGFAQYIKVPASWIVKLPQHMTARESMIYGTAGFTAALAVFRLQETGVEPGKGEVLVTGATGGVGCLAVGILAKCGYPVVAATGKEGEKDFLFRLGAKEIISREAINDTSGRPLLKGRWAAVVDSVGGNFLSTAIRSTTYGGVVACCGTVASSELSMTVYPFILRGVRLLGIDSVACPMAVRLHIWKKISEEWKLDNLNALFHECPLEELGGKIDLILKGEIKGRVVVDLTRL